jgi:hypothetical protein
MNKNEKKCQAYNAFFSLRSQENCKERYSHPFEKITCVNVRLALRSVSAVQTLYIKTTSYIFKQRCKKY